ncbi:sensor histidine kinase [Streptomyces longispororuber]|uniref:sensor histidine kinase n=1 Tax=Streptomyces longispororuber TaxID=68230 RepID=UPI00210946C9|nr:sensor histidine kinase [Streptomyces longispororuber]MCQ4205535.1 sensor histidine kinase [Streptomyces longispororuber]
MASKLERHTERHPHIADALIALALFGCAVYGSKISTPGTPYPSREWPAQLVAAVACLGILACRRAPRTIAVLTAAGAITTTDLGYLLTPLTLAPAMVALYWMAALNEQRTARLYGGVIIVVVIGTSLLRLPPDTSPALQITGPFLWLVLPLVIGSRVRLRRAYLDSVHARAEHAEHTREEEARLRVTEERVRIARELHDVVAHHMALANAQAGTAAHLAPTHPEQAQRILSDLSRTTSSALYELTSVVGLLRQDGESDTDFLEPAPGLDQLPAMLDAYRGAGLDVTLTTQGTPEPLSPGVDLTAYRIIQEALTNVTKHAAGTTAHVTLAYTGNRIVLTVTDDGTTAPSAPAIGTGRGGYGLIGMRERAHSVGGDLRAGPRPEGGFLVTTALPLQPHTLNGQAPR